MSWIKLRTNLADDPSVWLIADTLELDHYAVIGRLCAMWAWFDGQATAENPWVAVTTAALDKRLGCPGWCDACCAAGWLIIEEGRVGIPNFERHNGQSAKDRALTQSRQFKHRDRSGRFGSVSPSGHAPVTVPSRSCHGPVTVVSRSRNGASVTPALPDTTDGTTESRKSLQDNTLSGHAPVTLMSRSRNAPVTVDRDKSVTSPSQDRGERGERERRGEETTPPLINNSSSIPIQDQEAKEALHAAWMAKLAEAQSKASKVKEAT